MIKESSLCKIKRHKKPVLQKKRKNMIFYTLWKKFWQRDVMPKGKTCRAYPLESQVNSFHNWLKLILTEYVCIPLWYNKMVSKPSYVLWKTFLNWNTYLVKMKIKMIVQNGIQLIVLLQRSFLIRLPSHVQCYCTCTAFRSTSERLRGRRHHTVISSEIPKYFALFDMTGLSQTTGLEVLFTPLRWHFLPNKR